MRKISVILILPILAATLISLSGCGSASKGASHDESAGAAPVIVRLANVEHTRAALPVHAVGRLETKDELQLAFKTGGVVDRVLVDEGDRVGRGQRLAILSLTEVNAALTQARNAFERADRDLRRYRTLFADSLITLEQFQNAATAREVAKAGLDAAKFNREHAEIIAPCDGRILRRLTDDHELIGAGSPALVMAGFDKGWIVRAGLADRDLMRVSVGDSAVVVFDAVPEGTVSGAISEIGAIPNPVNGTYEIEIRVSARSRLVTGLIGKITITPAETGMVSLIPIEALVEADGDNGYVFAPSGENQTARKIPVEVAYIFEGMAGIRGDLPGIESVITSGATKLSDGAVFTVAQ